MKKLMTLLLLAASTTAHANDFMITPGISVGKITAHSSESDLKKVYGEKQVQQTTVYLEEAEAVEVTTIFPAEPMKSLVIFWKDSDKKKDPESIKLNGNASAWSTPKGVTLGKKLKDLEKLNGGPFEMSGFGWDYGGTVMDWKGGKLAREMTSKGRILVRFEEPEGKAVTAKERQKVTGDHAFSSSHPVLQKMNPRIYEIVISFDAK
jgi:hypothetical protein